MLEEFLSIVQEINEHPDVFCCGIMMLMLVYLSFAFIDCSYSLFMKCSHKYKFRHLKNKLRQYIDAYNLHDDLSTRFVAQDIIDDILRENGYIFDCGFGYIRKPDLFDKIISWFKRVFKSIR